MHVQIDYWCLHGVPILLLPVILGARTDYRCLYGCLYEFGTCMYYWSLYVCLYEFGAGMVCVDKLLAWGVKLLHILDCAGSITERQNLLQ